MTLYEYMKENNLTVPKLRKAILNIEPNFNLTNGALYHIVNGRNKPCLPKTAWLIEQATEGKVLAEELLFPKRERKQLEQEYISAKSFKIA